MVEMRTVMLLNEVKLISNHLLKPHQNLGQTSSGPWDHLLILELHKLLKWVLLRRLTSTDLLPPKQDLWPKLLAPIA